MERVLEAMGVSVEQMLSWRETEEGEVVVVLVDGRKLRMKAETEIRVSPRR